MTSQRQMTKETLEEKKKDSKKKDSAPLSLLSWNFFWYLSIPNQIFLKVAHVFYHANQNQLSRRKPLPNTEEL